MKWNISLILLCLIYLRVSSNAQRNGDLRLTEGNRGQLEVYFNGWGFICDDGWGSVDANTTCKILGYGTAVTTSIGRYNASTNYKLNLIDCIGNETSILDCGYRTYLAGYCSTREHIYIECRYVNGDLRLAGGDSGLVEVYYNGWGYICDDGWGTVDSNTICQILGYGAALSTNTSSYHVSRNYKLNYISCTGNESSILDCGYREYVLNFCSQNEHVYITCGPAIGDLRLTGGSSGLLEVYYNGWGFICDDGWNDVDADTACKILGYDTAITTTTGAYNSTSNYKLIHIGCRGNESNILDCSYNLYSSFHSSYCSADEHIYIECGPVNGDLRLLTGNSSGLLQVYYNGWGFICDNGWDTVDANTICRILGYHTVIMTSIARYNANTNYKLSEIRCSGGENSIFNCGYRTYSSSSHCSASKHIYIECGPVNGDLRLTEGNSGLLEVYFNGWGFICDDSWSIVDANTACKILDSGTALSTSTGRYNASTNYKLNRLDCIGNETSILDCGHTTNETNCSTNEHIYIECRYAIGDLRLTGGSSGLLEVYYNGWGFICDDGWNDVDSDTACKILGYDTAITTTTGAYNSTSNYKLILIGCRGNETSILDCSYSLYYSSFRSYYCSVNEHIYIECGPASLPQANPSSLVNASADSIEIRWEEYMFPVSNYSICVRKSNEIDCGNNFTTSNLNFLIQNLEPETEYFVIITAITEYGPSPTSERRGFTTEPLPSPIQPTLVDRDAVSIEIEWQEYLFPVSNYSLCVTKYNEISCNNIFTTSNTSFRIQNLEPETEYFVTISAVTEYGPSPKSNRRGFVTESLPLVNQPILVSRDADRIEIEWQEYLFPVLNYLLCVTKSNKMGCKDNFTTSYTSFLIQDLEPETEYFVTISAVTEHGPSPKSNRAGFTTAPLPPASRPILVDANAVSIQIRWVEYEFPVLHYSIYVEISNNRVHFSISINTSFLIQYLEPETEYFVIIAAFTEYGSSPASERGGFVTESLPLVSQPILVSRDVDSIEIEWQDYLFPLLNYLLCVTKSNEIGCNNNFTTSNTSFLIQDLKPETEYFVTISAFTKHGLSPKSSRAGFTTAPLPQPNLPNFTKTNRADSIKIEWEEYMFPVIHYSLCVIKSNEIGCKTIFTTSETSYILQNLEPDTNYLITITVFTDIGESPASEGVAFATVLPLLSKPTLASVSKDSAKIEWDEYSFLVSSYRLCYVKLEDNSETCETILSDTSFTIKDLEPETEYSVTIIAITEPNGRPSPSSEGLIFETPRENKPPTITSPAEDIERIITDTTTRTNFNLIQECIATGFPQPIVTWSGDLSMKFVTGNVLSIKPGDLEEIKDVNPLRFICNATNSEGSVAKNVNILVRIELSDIIDKLINVTDEQAANLTNIITTNTNGVNTSSENTTEIRQDLEIIAKDFNNLVDKYLITSKSVSNTTVINLLDTAQAIISKDSNIEEEETKDEVETGSNVAPASPVLLTTLSTVESIASNAARSLEDSENDTSLIYRARTIIVIAQNINLPKIDSETSNLIIPKVEKGVMNDIEERIQIPSENFGILSSNNRNLRIATTIVDTMEIRSESKKENSPKLFSNIISLVIPSKTDQKIKLAQPVKLLFPVSRGNPNNLQVCSFLDDAYWSDEGLRTDEMNNVTDCYTDHLTSFAVFVTPRGLGPDNRIASIVSYAVVSISFISLIVSLVLFILSGKKFFKVEANIVYFNYCLSLTLAFGLFLFGIETGKFNEILCKIIAFLLHYLWLSVFVWTLCNGILIIYKLTLGIMRQQKIYPYLIVFGWTFPIIIPIITVVIKHDKYVNTAQHCFLTYEDGIIWAFIAPIIAIILVNMVILIVSVIRISTTKFGSEKLKENQVIKSALVSTLILTPLLGIPWIILLLNIFIINSVVQWGFIIVNGLMGIFFFFAITMRNAEVKKLFKKSKIDYSQVSASTENKSSGMLSKKFKRSVSRERDTTDTLSATPSEACKKGNYFALEQMGTSEVQDDGGAVKSPTGSISSRYNTPPRPKSLPKPKSKSSRDESEQETRYYIPVTVKPDQPSTYDMLADAEGEKYSPVYTEIPEESSFSRFEYPSDATKQNTGKSVEVDEKLYESMK